MGEKNTKDVVGFAKTEKELNLFERKYAGVPYWQLIRFDVCESVFSNRVEIDNKVKDELWKNYRYLLSTSFKLLMISIKEALSPELKKHCELIEMRQTDIKDRFFDAWEMPKSIQYISIRNCELNADLDYKRHFLAGPYLKTQLMYFISKLTRSYEEDREEKQRLIELASYFTEKFGNCMSANEMEARIRKGIIKARCYRKYYEKLFERTKCKALLVVCYYQPHLFPAYEIARKRNIKIIELQHGVINNHEEYWFEDRRGVNNLVPDYLLTYGELHNSWIQLVDGEVPVAIGCPFQDKQIEKELDLPTDEHLVVIYPDPTPQFEAVVNEFINTITSMGYRVIVKLHPSQTDAYRYYYPVLSKNTRAEVVTSQKEGIFHWLKMARHHVMSSTTVGLEAMVYDDINVCIAENVPHDQTQPLLDCGAARGFKTAQELVHLVTHPEVDNRAIREIREKLWKKDPVANIESFFKTMQENGWTLPQS